jgi:hypothetical protein
MEFLNWIFFAPSRLLALWPYAGFAIAAILIGAQLIRSLDANESTNQRFSLQWFRKAPVFTGLMWCIFNLYEMQMKAVMLTAEATFSMARLDLMVLTPLLYVLTAFAVAALLSPNKQ